jgi:YggT family protein
MAPILMLILSILKYLIFADFILSWVMPDPTRFPRNLTTQITDPLYAPIRALLKPQQTGGLDFSPMVVLLLVQAMQSMLTHAL